MIACCCFGEINIELRMFRDLEKTNARPKARLQRLCSHARVSLRAWEERARSAKVYSASLKKKKKKNWNGNSDGSKLELRPFLGIYTSSCGCSLRICGDLCVRQHQAMTASQKSQISQVHKSHKTASTFSRSV